MRDRLVTAAIVCIETHGYAGASVSRIVQQAGVSRGAYLHHFRAKHLIFKAVALRLVGDVFRRLGDMEPNQGSTAEDLRVVLHTIWDAVVTGPEGRVFAELMLAARTDEVVAQHLRRPAFRALRLFGWGAQRRIPIAKTSPLTSSDVVRLAQWTLRGMALDTALSLDPKFFHRQIDLFVDMLAPHLPSASSNGG
ncbi:MAG: TetR/AcrR family transcriptional regulator [Pseudomonadota bacterium]